jgi:hypothetical protein
VRYRNDVTILVKIEKSAWVLLGIIVATGLTILLINLYGLNK